MKRREFLKKAGLVMGGMGIPSVLHPAIAKAISINPEKGSTFYDAGHIVILMQENRSFDHCFGTLQGVKGFGDPLPMLKKNREPVFLQKDSSGKTFSPFRLDIKNTRATWMSSLPHAWENQIAAWNNGNMDNWIEAKKSGIKEYENMPLTLGYYTREDLPFYYQLADAFTIFDHYFCSSLTGTTPNRLFLWTGTLRSGNAGDSIANVKNDQLYYDKNVSWKSYPEVLEDHNITWKVYQNEISLTKGLSETEDAFLTNFTDNPLEWFSQYHVKFSYGYLQHAKKRYSELKKIKYDKGIVSDDIQKELETLKFDIEHYTPENFARLSKREQDLHTKAFTVNSADPDFHSLEFFEEQNGEKFYLPKGDILHQFRQDVADKKLPQVSWLVASERFSDHPTSPWYGAWYISEILNILTANPEVWKKTIFLITYDENDGYYDHVPPFTPPNNPSQKPDFHGKAGTDFVDGSQKFFREDNPPFTTTGPVGLGFRVPMIIASPWSRGGYVNSEISDHTSVIQFIEDFFKHKNGKTPNCENISDWRRAICGNLTSAFQPGQKQKEPEVLFLKRDEFVKTINNSKKKPLPTSFNKGDKDLYDYRDSQERGIRKSCALPYDFNVDIVAEGIKMHCGKGAAVPIIVLDYSDAAPDFSIPYTLYPESGLVHKFHTDKENSWILHGPNSFRRAFKFYGNLPFEATLKRKGTKGNVELQLKNLKNIILTIKLTNHFTKLVQKIGLRNDFILEIESEKFGGWYDFELEGENFFYRFTGRQETGKVSVTNPHLC